MDKAYIVTGTLTDDRTVTLDEALSLPHAKVRLIVEPFESEGVQNGTNVRKNPNVRPYDEVMAEIRASQKARGHKPRTKEEVDAYIQEERESWDTP